MKRKFKIIVFFLTIILVSTIAYGCGKNSTQNTNTTASTTITASAAQQSKFEFQKVAEQQISMLNIIYFWREKSTDTMYIEKIRSSSGGEGSGLTQMMDPETGLPLTYTKWLNSYR